MRRKFNYGGSLFATCLALTALPLAFADTTTVTTKTISSGNAGSASSFVLPSAKYAVVDPLTGIIRGEYVTGSRTIDTVPLTSNYVIMDKTSRKLVATFDANGNLIGLSNAPAAENVIVSVDLHRAALEKKIDDLVLQGQITGTQADALRLEIANVFPGQKTLSRTVTYDRALTTDSGLYSVESHLIKIAPKSYTTVVMPKFIATNGQIILPDDLTHRKFRLEKEMDDQFAAGHLSQAQIVELKADMTELYNRESAYRVTGLMSDHDASLLSADLDAFQAKLDHCMSTLQAGRNVETN